MEGEEVVINVRMPPGTPFDRSTEVLDRPWVILWLDRKDNAVDILALSNAWVGGPTFTFVSFAHVS